MNDFTKNLLEPLYYGINWHKEQIEKYKNFPSVDNSENIKWHNDRIKSIQDTIDIIIEQEVTQ